MNVRQLIHQLIVDETGRKDDCGQIHLTAEELAIFQKAGVEEGSYSSVGLRSSYGWFIARETFCSMMERYPGEYMDQVRKVREEMDQRERKKRARNSRTSRH